MKKTTIITSILAAISVILVFGCKTPELIASKTGAQLWGENCQRCHNMPAPTALSKENWEVAGTHMKIRANLTEAEKDKVVEFLKSAN